jgi:hypothetical protein
MRDLHGKKRTQKMTDENTTADNADNVENGAVDKVQKINQVDQSSYPEFPVSRKGGYLEEAVDEWLEKHFQNVRDIITYQNYSVDQLEAVQTELERLQNSKPEVVATEDNNEAEVRANEAEARAVAAEERAVHAEQRAVAAEAALTEARTAAPVAASAEDDEDREVQQASQLLQRATQVAREHVEEAKQQADRIREEAELTITDLREDIERLEGTKFATKRTLEDFFTEELNKIRENDLFNVVTEEQAATEEQEVPESAEESADEDQK